MAVDNNPFRAEPEVLWNKLLSAAKIGFFITAVAFILTYFFFNKFGMAIWVSGGFGLAFASMRYSAIKGNYRRLQEHPPQFAGERVVIEGFATHRRYIQGWSLAYMCLTEKRLHLSYYPFYEDDPGNSFFLKNIKHISTYSHFFIIPSGICLTTMDDKKHYIRVGGWRDGWLEELYDAWKAVHPVSPAKINLQPLPVRVLPPSEVVFIASASVADNGKMQVWVNTDFPEGDAQVEMHVYNFRQKIIEPVYNPGGHK